MTFGDKLKQARMDAGLKQSDLAKIIGTTNTTISNWEKGVSKPDLDMLSYICGALNVKASYFLQATLPEDEISIIEFNIIKKYRALDDHGKRNVDYVIENEYTRCSSEKLKGQLSIYDVISSKDLAELKKATRIPDLHFSDEFTAIFNESSFKNEIFSFPTEPGYEALNAAHARTDVPITDADVQIDKNIMDDENF